MPFADELVRGPVVVPYDPGWPDAFLALARRVEAALGSLVVSVDHIGSTAVPGLLAKDCIDVQVRVDALDDGLIISRFEQIGFRVRPEPWNRVEVVGDERWPKLVFAPPAGERASNVHVRAAGSETARLNLLFRDFLRADATARVAWGDFKQQLALVDPDIYIYGRSRPVQPRF